MTVKILGRARDLKHAKDDATKIPKNRWFYVMPGAYTKIQDDYLCPGLLVRRAVESDLLNGVTPICKYNDESTVAFISEDKAHWGYLYAEDLTVEEPL